MNPISLITSGSSGSSASPAELGLLIALLAPHALPTAQDESQTTAAAEDTAAEVPSASAEALRQRIHGMRMNLLLGGDRVRKAEDEAIDFYGGKMELVEQRLDSIRVELAEKRASYDVLLDRALNAESAGGRAGAMREAAVLRREISALGTEADELEGRRKGYSKLVSSIESRERDRERLVAQIETSSGPDDGLGLPLPSIGLAPDVQPSEGASPLDDPRLIEDLLERDPLRARRLLFEMDAESYWERFPLRPPAELIRTSLPFPPPDLPGSR